MKGKYPHEQKRNNRKNRKEIIFSTIFGETPMKRNAESRFAGLFPNIV